ncbi:MAG: hypothetical protein WKG00_18495 [Polyangiaceae bacterium]
MSFSAPLRWVPTLAALLPALAGCSLDVALGEAGRNEGGSSSIGSVGAGPIEDCHGKACGTYCVAYGELGWCDGAGICRSEHLCAPYQPCAGAPCGEPCEPCAPGTRDADCPKNGIAFACDLAGQCAPAGSSCGPCDYGAPDCPYDPCLAQNLPCGAPCNPDCEPKDDVCLAAASLVCDGNHECRPELEVKCDPCIDAKTQAPKLCGEECWACEATPWRATCDRPFSPSGITVCDGLGACVPPEQFTSCSESYWDPCVDASCGAPCSLCNPMEAGCWPEQQLQCNDALQCVGAALCTWNGCAGLACGESCWPCDPEEGFCAQKFCDAYLTCVLDAPDACP